MPKAAGYHSGMATPKSGLATFLFACLSLAAFGQTPRGAQGIPTVVNGFVVAITVTDAGAGYTATPFVTISGGGGNGATAVATVSNGSVDKVIVTDAGSGYSGTPAVTIDLPPDLKPPFSDGLFAFFTFEGDASDQSGNGRNGTPAGTYNFEAVGIEGHALRIIGDNSLFYSGGGHLLIPSLPASANSGFSISMWVRDEVIGAPPVNTSDYVSFGVEGAAVGIRIDGVSPLVFYINGNGVGSPIYPSVELSQFSKRWKQLALTYEPGSFQAYIDGKLVEEKVVTIDVFPVVYAALGRQWWNNGAASSARMSVTYDNVRIYSRALPAEEIRDLYAFELPEPPTLTLEVKTVQVTLRVKPTKKYQVEASTNLKAWTKVGEPFVAESAEVIRVFDVTEVGQFFRIYELP